MSPSSGKASGKTPRFLLEERIAELEAELRTECVHCGQPIPHVHKHESTRELALRLRAEKAEAEVERLSLLSQKPRENGMLPSLHEHQFEYDAAEGQDTCRTCGRRQGV